MSMTVADLRKAIKGVDGKMPIYSRDHDHSTYETNGPIGLVEVLDQEDMDEWDKKSLDEPHIIKGKYLVIATGH